MLVLRMIFLVPTSFKLHTHTHTQAQSVNVMAKTRGNRNGWLRGPKYHWRNQALRANKSNRTIFACPIRIRSRTLKLVELYHCVRGLRGLVLGFTVTLLRKKRSWCSERPLMRLMMHEHAKVLKFLLGMPGQSQALKTCAFRLLKGLGNPNAALVLEQAVSETSFR